MKKIIIGLGVVSIVLINIVLVSIGEEGKLNLKLLGSIAYAEAECSPDVLNYPDIYWNYKTKTGYSYNNPQTIYKYRYVTRDYFGNIDVDYVWAFSKSDALYILVTDRGINVDDGRYFYFNDTPVSSDTRVQVLCDGVTQDCCIEYKPDWVNIVW